MNTLPKEFLERSSEIFGADYREFIESLSQPAPVSIRHNPNKLSDAFSNAEQVPWSTYGRYLSVRPSFTMDPLFHSGCYYVQEASSQSLEVFFNSVRTQLIHPLKVLDLCAAPGGKSTHLLSLMKSEDLLVSNEIIPSRNNILRQNLIRWGNANVIITQNEASVFSRLENFFDVILVDAPCSGEGLFRKDPEAVKEWSLQNVASCAIRQQKILSEVIPALRPGGFLIYSTCTFEPSENEYQVRSLFPDFEKVDIHFSDEGVKNSDYGFHFLPHHVKGEGFFISMLRKNGDAPPGFHGKFKPEAFSNNSYHHLLKNPSDYNFFQKDNNLYAIANIHYAPYWFLREKFYIRQAGIFLGELKGRELIPSAALALSGEFSGATETFNASVEQAVSFLRGESFSTGDTRGWTLITHRQFALGWMKNIGTRGNNYYPKEWRIRKQS